MVRDPLESSSDPLDPLPMAATVKERACELLDTQKSRDARSGLSEPAATSVMSSGPETRACAGTDTLMEMDPDDAAPSDPWLAAPAALAWGRTRSGISHRGARAILSFAIGFGPSCQFTSAPAGAVGRGRPRVR